MEAIMCNKPTLSFTNDNSIATKKKKKKKK